MKGLRFSEDHWRFHNCQCGTDIEDFLWHGSGGSHGREPKRAKISALWARLERETRVPAAAEQERGHFGAAQA